MEEYSNDSDDLYDRIDDVEEERNQFDADEAEEDNTHNADTAEEAPEPKPVKVKRPVLRPQPKLNLEALQGPKGLLALNELFKNFNFRGGNHEEEDYANIMRLLEQWAYRLFPKFHFEDTLKRLETLGKKREVQVYLRKIRNGLVSLNDGSDVVRNFDDDDEGQIGTEVHRESAVTNEVFDELLAQQIVRSQHSSIATPSRNVAASVNYGTPLSSWTNDKQTPSQSGLSDEQKARIERNKQMALEKRMQKQRELEQTQVVSPMDLDP